ncbi:MAG: vitamin K epoxide reductase family protein [Anaerolineae bacterium]|jgi:uncharacterized membrane protein|nr:vitamin K epoxide reductase family protein [Anaerolineae bacterium]
MTTGQILTEATPANRFRFSLRTGIWFCVLLGIAVSGYLSYVKLTEVPMACVAGDLFNCDAVQNSIYSRFLGVPIAYLGLAMYLSLAGLLLLEKRSAFFATNGLLLRFGIALFAWFYSVYLVYLQVFVLEALCQWCLMHEIIMTILFAFISYELWRELGGDKAKNA